MSNDNKEAARKIRGQIARRYIDASMLNINMVGGTVYLTGVIGVLRMHPNVVLKEEMDTITKVLRTVPGVKEVIWDVSQRT